MARLNRMMTLAALSAKMDYPEMRSLLYQLYVAREWTSAHVRLDLYGRHATAWAAFYAQPYFESLPVILRDGWQDDWIRASRHIFLQRLARHEKVQLVGLEGEIRSAKQIPDEPLEIITRWLEGHQVIRAMRSETTLEQMAENLRKRTAEVLDWIATAEEEIWDRASEYCLARNQQFYRRFPRGALPASRTRWNVDKFLEEGV